jgi:acetyl-CoA carboxylase biotin carboxylase subunit
LGRDDIMFKKILVANRGEIALRVLFACRELGIKTVAVYSEADENSLHVRFADEDICIGPAKSSESYLNVPAIISAAEITGADAIHPGYGFLSESAYLAEVCEACHIRFIGPDPSVIRLLGDKAKARRAMKKAGVPMLPGSDGPVESEEKALKIAATIGYPVIIKAVAGGGGRGMRIVKASGELAHAFKTAQREAEAAFGVGDVYIEKYLESPRHIEFQVLGDHHGNVIHLGERECSIQRRHQKLLEEAPSVALSDKVRRRMGGMVADAARAVQYTNAGTFEFLMDEKGNVFFMEVNTRIQVEHPVTEMVTGIDIVKEQIRIAAGERLSFKQSEVTFTGHAIECRINAECPDTFVPSPGVIRAFSLPGGPGVRVDTAAHSECTISPYYDSMIAKVIAHGRDRQEAIARMKRTLEMSVIEGIRTTIPLHIKLLNDPDFVAGRLSTHFMERYQPRPKTALAESA